MKNKGNTTIGIPIRSAKIEKLLTSLDITAQVIDLMEEKLDDFEADFVEKENELHREILLTTGIDIDDYAAYYIDQEDMIMILK